MRRISVLVLLICLRLLLAAQSKPGAFQSNKDADPQAKALLKQVKDNLNIEKGVEINFEFKYTAAESKPTIEKGKVEIKGKKFHLTLGEQEIFSDQKTLWTYLKKRNEVQLQNAEGIDDDPLSPFKLLQIHDSPDFTYILNGETKTSASIEFKPLDKNADFFKVKADIDKSKKQYKRLVLYLKNGDLYELNVAAIAKKTLNDEIFTPDLKKYPGAKVEDLR